ncbi:glycoside hydrolase [Frankia sp. CcI156]|jgi:cell wall-associated NlpC family hydrolase|uniref:NLP/P60 n=1 Tax=Frankia casuarinae (strain DSM 45818 / CECT 9043 / HFP020203 / CcI3) TaxID=106370 RepID=Q2JH07_FRACC|nr:MULTISPECIES: NlpC/P60 family protein [Frankia]ABD09435.1 NLP/P60 [Frankia casuarinae]ETA02762.1 cell wall-associated hydrolase, invasion-associated protein [Frankia sp. CcI6]EYT94165.1 cell wall-associated hydrolase, invasion-associated protein [Frankia casuarinae]KDA44357.1 cell wall-associated hydrolase, invasion-associated protein [Frankia sp. BMG5.23]KEZ35047.1 cell wall-associated hydrolase, invasion-associated protein [Frankia sp. CeD]
MARGFTRKRSRWLVWTGAGMALAVGGIVMLVAVLILIITGPFIQDQGGGNRTIRNSDGIPAEYLQTIIDAANAAGCAEVTPALLAAQLHQESGFNPRARSPVGAMGIAQFMPGTWASHGQGDVWNPADAIPAAARYDCAVAASVASVSGAAQEKMLAAYNAGAGAVLAFAGIPPYTETRNYVRTILAQAQVYGDALELGVDIPAGSVAPMVAFMRSQIGKPYVWGATGPDAWDCSSLVREAYRRIGIELPRVTTDQLRFGPQVAGVDPQPGDLLFTPGTDGTAEAPGHVGMYIGDGRVIAAKGARWGVVESDISDWSGTVAVTRPLARQRS